MRPGLSTLRNTLLLALVLSPGLALAKKAAWGKRATAESTAASIDREFQGAGSALRARFGEAVANAVDDTHRLGTARRPGAVDFESTRDREGSVQRVSESSEAGEGVLVTRSRQVDRTRNGMAVKSSAEQSGPNGAKFRSRVVMLDGKRPKTAMIGEQHLESTATGELQHESRQTLSRSGWGGKVFVEQEESTTTRRGSFAAEGLREESESVAVWGRGKNKLTERRTVASSGQQRRVRTSEERKLGGLLTVRTSEGFATNRRGKEKQVGTSRQVVFGGKTLNLGRQRADRAPPTRWAPRDATASRGRVGGRGR